MKQHVNNCWNAEKMHVFHKISSVSLRICQNGVCFLLFDMLLLIFFPFGNAINNKSISRLLFYGFQHSIQSEKRFAVENEESR